MYADPKPIVQIGDGHLYIMGKPAGGEDLEDDLRFLRHLGITRIVSLLEQDEASEVGLSSQRRLCDDLGLAFESLPIEDRTTPPDIDRFLNAIATSYENVMRGDHLVAHCRAGIGRSGVFCCSVLIRHGHAVSRAIDLVSQARGFEIPDTQSQIDWLHIHQERIQGAP